MTVAELRRRVSASEFTEWQAMWDLEPFGDEWSRSALQAALYANAHRAKGSPAFEIDDFMPRRSRPFEAERMKEKLMRAFSGFGLRRKDRDA